jgi:hypothetical protein
MGHDNLGIRSDAIAPDLMPRLSADGAGETP